MTFSDAINKQYEVIKKKYGKKAADSANYGWGSADNYIETKVYVQPCMILVTTFKGTNSKQITHNWHNY